MKWVGFALFLLLIPVLAVWLRTRPNAAPWAYGLLTFLPFVVGPWHLSVAPYALPLWSGAVKGWEFSLLDGVALGILFGTRNRGGLPANFWPFVAYISAVVLAVLQAKFTNIALAYVLQVVRAFVVFLAVARVAFEPRGERALLGGFAFGLGIQFLYALSAKAGGALQTGGSLGHQNLLGFVTHIPLMFAFASLITLRSRRTALVAVIAGLTIATLTASRATIAFAALGLATTLTLSLLLNFTSRKFIVGIVGMLLLGAAVPLASYTLEERFAAQGTTFLSEDLERDAFARAAKQMISQRPWGVGPNFYVFVANTEGYSQRAGVAWTVTSRSTSVHNSYLLIAAETGYFGLAAFVCLIVGGMIYAFSGAIRYRKYGESDLLIGLGCGVMAMSLHAFYEWMYAVYASQYVLASGLGLIAGLRARLNTSGHNRGKKALNHLQAQRLSIAPAA